MSKLELLSTTLIAAAILATPALARENPMISTSPAVCVENSAVTGTAMCGAIGAVTTDPWLACLDVFDVRDFPPQSSAMHNDRCCPRCVAH